MSRHTTKSLGWAAIALFVSIGLAACSGSGKTPAQTGKLIDAAVQGASYVNSPSGLSGTTDANGNYNYQPGDRVTFSLGNIIFPTVNAKGTVTPLDLAGTTDVNNVVVVNIARLLQTLDADSDPSNGITLDSTVTGSAYDFNQPTAGFENDFDADFPSLTLITQADAIAHLEAELAQLNSSGGGTLGANETAATIPASLVKSYELTYAEINPGSGITDGTTATFVVGSDNSLTINGANTLLNPVFYRGNDREAIWTDAANNLAYAFSDVQGTFNEVNVSNAVQYDQPGFAFYGQYREPPSDTPFTCPETFGSLVVTSDDPEGITLLGGSDLCPKTPTGAASTGALIWSDSWFPEYPDRKRGSITLQTSAGLDLASASPIFFQVQVRAANNGTWRLFVNPGTLADLGVTLNTVDKTVTFTNTAVPALTAGSFPGTGTLTLNGVLKYSSP